jgi:hypothetical protein
MKLDPNHEDTKQGELLTMLGYRGETNCDMDYYIKSHNLKKGDNIIANKQMEKIFTKKEYTSINELND